MTVPVADSADPLVAKRDQLLELLAGLGSCAVAYSGGVDSAVVAKAARLALGDAAVAVTGDSDALAEGELDEARAVAELIGIRHVIVPTEELANPAYAANSPDRCYHCKTELYERLEAWAGRLDVAAIVNGANADDLGDYRPGMQAAREHAVRSPLAECGITKAEVRALAAAWELPIADKPATPCLSSRIAYGQEVTPERLRMIDRAEQLVRSMLDDGEGEAPAEPGSAGASPSRAVRVRYHADDTARIEVLLEALARLCEPPIRERLVAELHQLGFKFITLDLAGFRSGSFAPLIPAESLRRFS